MKLAFVYVAPASERQPLCVGVTSWWCCTCCIPCYSLCILRLLLIPPSSSSAVTKIGFMMIFPWRRSPPWRGTCTLFPGDQPKGTLQPTVMKYTQAQMNRMKEANKARQAAQPLKLIKLVKELQQESGRVAEDSRTLNAAHQNAAAAELASRLKAKLYNPNNQQGLDKWRRQRLKLIKKREEAALATAQESGQEKEEVPFAEELAIVEASSLLVEEEGTGLLPSAAEIEDGIIPGRPLPEECRAEAHTDYDGAAVRWGLTYHVESAADCCQACLDHARSAEGDGKKCNVWVYCPSEDGCYSPDIYEHQHRECWLKQADEPKLNFKGRYDEEYRNQHPTAPVIVPWVSGVIRL